MHGAFGWLPSLTIMLSEFIHVVLTIQCFIPFYVMLFFIYFLAMLQGI